MRYLLHRRVAEKALVNGEDFGSHEGVPFLRYSHAALQTVSFTLFLDLIGIAVDLTAHLQ
jgi:hypothetical protein